MAYEIIVGCMAKISLSEPTFAGILHVAATGVFVRAFRAPLGLLPIPEVKQTKNDLRF